MFSLVNLTKVSTAVQSHVLLPSLVQNRISTDPGHSTRKSGHSYSQNHVNRSLLVCLRLAEWSPMGLRAPALDPSLDQHTGGPIQEQL